MEAAAQPAASVSRRSPIEQRRPDPDFQATVEKVQEGLTLPVMQELNARVDLDREQPAAVATQYLQEEGYVE